MSFWHVDVATTFRLIGFVDVVLPISVWFVLRGKHPRQSLLSWCAGAAAFGVGSVLAGLREMLPPLLAFHVAALLVHASFPLRAGALRLEMGRPAAWARLALTWAVIHALAVAISMISVTALHVASVAIQWGATLWLAITAGMVWKLTRLPSARLIAAAHAIFLVAVSGLIIQALLAGGAFRISGDSLGTVLAAAASLLTAMYGSLGFVGLAIERAHRSELSRAQALAREAAQRVAAEAQSRQLKDWLNEREEMLRLLAHEVRQPLNNAMAALHATHRALGAKDLDHAAASSRVRRAEGVLSQIAVTLDNTLAATALLASPDRIEPRDVDVDAVTALSIGDLPPEQRQRIQLHRVSQVRTAMMDSGLMRLALRNLLSNACLYTPPDAPVVLRVTDSDEPLGLVFAVIDHGAGIAPGLASRLFQRGVRGQRDAGGHGLGLYVVRRVMELHGGSVDLGANPGGGAVFRLTLPQTDEPYSVALPTAMPLDRGAAQPPARAPRKT